MSTASTAKRRRSQARKAYRHMSPQSRPHYCKVSAEKSARKLARAREMAKKSFKKKA